MKKRIIKKRAKMYLNGKIVPSRFRTEYYQAYNDGTPPVIKTFAVYPGKVERLIREMASNQGWSGCHWDDPLLWEVDDSEKWQYEEDYNPPHMWA